MGDHPLHINNVLSLYNYVVCERPDPQQCPKISRKGTRPAGRAPSKSYCPALISTCPLKLKESQN